MELTFVENYLGVDIFVEDHKDYTKMYFAEVHDRELRKYREIRQPDLDYVKELIRDVVAYSYYHELRHVCLTFRIDVATISYEDEVANAVKDALEKRAIQKVKEIFE